MGTVMGKYIFVTPYYKEDPKFLKRCLESVKNQTIACDHILIADGFPQKWIHAAGVRHISLDQAHADAGNTSRGLGLLLAIAEEYDGIGLLDADNWLEKNHLEICLEAASKVEGGIANCDFVIAQRYLRRIDETIMPFPEEDDHVDTSCFFFLPGSYSFLPQWSLIPKRLSAVGDRFFFAFIMQKGLRVATTNTKTVNYHNMYAYPYSALGETPPVDAKEPWVADLINSARMVSNVREAIILNRLLGFEFFRSPASPQIKIDAGIFGNSPSRNSLCYCGSGKKYKHCHGRFS
jgi:glycosyltransferase involved in cell wall biosynthesis